MYAYARGTRGTSFLLIYKAERESAALLCTLYIMLCITFVH